MSTCLHFWTSWETVQNLEQVEETHVMTPSFASFQTKLDAQFDSLKELYKRTLYICCNVYFLIKFYNAIFWQRLFSCVIISCSDSEYIIVHALWKFGRIWWFPKLMQKNGRENKKHIDLCAIMNKLALVNNLTFFYNDWLV